MSGHAFVESMPSLSLDEMRAEIRKFRLEWDGLARCHMPVALSNEREQSELDRGDVMIGGPWSFRGDRHERKELDRLERLRQAALFAGGFYDWDVRPNFESPEYAFRRQEIKHVLSGLGSMGGFTAASVRLVPKPWFMTSSGCSDGYDARYGVTLDGSDQVDSVLSQGSRGNDATNASSTLTVNSSWAGTAQVPLMAFTGTGISTDVLLCGGAASDWRVHNGAPPGWSMFVAGQFVDPISTQCPIANRNNYDDPTLGLSLTKNSGTGSLIWNMSNGVSNVGNQVCFTTATSQFVNVGTRKWVVGFNIGLGLAGINSSTFSPDMSRYSRRSAPDLPQYRVQFFHSYFPDGVNGTSNGASNFNATPSDTDAQVMAVCACPNGTRAVNGYVAMAYFLTTCSLAWTQAGVDHVRALIHT